MNKKIKLHQRQWYKLDNAAKIFPGQNTSSYSNVFRLSATLKEKVDPVLLEKALEAVMPRFPSFDVRMRNGVFWHYLEKNPNSVPPVMPDSANPCIRIKWKENKGYLIRVFYYEKRVSVEFYHVITDGFGASRFFMTLLAVYLRLKGADIPCGGMVLDINERPAISEQEDAYLKFVKSKAKAKRVEKFAYQAKGKRLPKHLTTVTTGYMPVDVIKTKAKEQGVTITEYIAGLLVWVMYNLQKQERFDRQKNIGVQIPVNVRQFFKTDTLRNFMLCYSFQIDPKMGEYTFPEILKQLSLYIRYINNEKTVQSMMNGNAAIEKNPIMRIIPSVLKDFGINMLYRVTGEKATSSLISNLGAMQAPPEMSEHIDKMSLVLARGMVNAARCGAVSYNGTLALSVTNIYESTRVQREIFTTLVKLGIPVKIESNRTAIMGGEG
ncbi:MAG: alcohol acetyltransferase [Clostridia bacterium]|nr:alcohol acetyltransferase [Clostridia bacterium]